jgi:hypothetical protein
MPSAPAKAEAAIVVVAGPLSPPLHGAPQMALEVLHPLWTSRTAIIIADTQGPLDRSRPSYHWFGRLGNARATTPLSRVIRLRSRDELPQLFSYPCSGRPSLGVIPDEYAAAATVRASGAGTRQSARRRGAVHSFLRPSTRFATMRLRMGTAGCEHAATQFDSRSIGGRFDELLLRACGRHEGAR